MPPAWWQPTHFCVTSGAMSRFQVTAPSGSVAPGALGEPLSVSLPHATLAAAKAPVTNARTSDTRDEPAVSLPNDIDGPAEACGDRTLHARARPRTFLSSAALCHSAGCRGWSRLQKVQI